MEIFIHREDGDFGPYTIEDVQHYLETGDLLPEDHAWYEGAPDWMSLEEIPGVMPPGPVPVTAPAPPRNTTGLPEWIPPRRTDDPDSTSTTSFASPPVRPIGIRTLSPSTGKPAPSSEARRSLKARETARNGPSRRVTQSEGPARLESVSPAPLERPMPAVRDYEEPDLLPDPANARSLRSMGTRNMVFGVLWFIGGLGVTLYLYMTPFGQAHGGLYLISWAAIGGGLIQFLRGLNQARKE